MTRRQFLLVLALPAPAIASPRRRWDDWTAAETAEAVVRTVDPREESKRVGEPIDARGEASPGVRRMTREPYRDATSRLVIRRTGQSA